MQRLVRHALNGREHKKKMIDKEVGSLWRAKGTKKLYLFLGEARPSDYAAYGMDRLPPTWKLDFPPDYLMVDLTGGGFFLKTEAEIKLYFDPLT